MLKDQDLDFLRGLSVFAGLKEDVVSTIGEQANRIDIDDDRILFREGEPAKEMLVVLDGMLEVVKESVTGAEECIATLGPGDVAGEMSLVDIQPRSAAVRAIAPASVVVLSHADLATVYREDKQSYTLLVLNIAREISLRLRKLDAALANIMSEIRSVTSTYDSRMTQPRDADKSE
jgi:CRP-like cAMP-binding protein